METYYFNKEVIVDAVTFKGQLRPTAHPAHLWIDDEDITVTDTLGSYEVRNSQQSYRLFDVTDGHDTYRLRLDPVRYAWTVLRRLPMEQARG